MKLKRLLYLILLALMVVSCGKDDAPKPPTDTNTAPTIASQTFETSESIDDTVIIGTVSASDADNDPLTFSITSNSDNLFEIGTTDGKLSLAANKSLNYVIQAQHTITVSVTDGTDNAQATVTINVMSTNPVPQMEDQSFEVAENIGDTDVIGTVDATDEDTLEFSITDDASGLFEIDMVTGKITLKTGESLDFETTTDYTLTVSANDKVNDPVTAQITITVTDVPEAQPNDKNAFVTTWKIDNAEDIAQFDFDQDFNTYDFTVNWGDGTIEHLTINTYISHAYATAGEYKISIVGSVPSLQMSDTEVKFRLKSIDQWGTNEWATFSYSFIGSKNMVYNATDVPDLSQVTTLAGMFKDCTVFDADLGDWDIGTITSMANMLDGTGLSTENYSKTLTGWATQDLVQTGVSLGASGLEHCGVDTFRATLTVTFGWNIIGDVKCQ